MINILYISPVANNYGSENSLLALIKALDKQRYHPFILLFGHGTFCDILRKNEIDFTILNLYTPNILNTIANNIRFSKLIKQKAIQLIHINFHQNIHKLAIPLLLCKLPLIIHIRTHHWIDIIDKIVISRCKKIICVSKAIGREIIKKRRSDLFSKIRHDKVEVIYNGRDLSLFEQPFDRDKLRADLGVDKHQKLIGIIGGVTPRKSVDLFIRASKIVAEQKKDVRFVVVGDVYSNKDLQYKRYVINLCDQLNLKDKCAFMGARNDIPNVMRCLDILVAPSKREALGSVLIEGMAAGIPIVSTSVDGTPEVIGHNEAGLLINSLNHNDFAQAIIRLINNKELSKKMSKKGRERANKFFDAKIYAKKLENIYEDILSNKE